MSWRGMVAAVVAVGVLATLTGAVWALRSGEGDPSGALAAEPVDYVALGDSYSAGPMIPVVREDAAQMAALQIQAEHGAALADSPEEFEFALEKYVTKQVRQPKRLITRMVAFSHGMMEE